MKPTPDPQTAHIDPFDASRTRLVQFVNLMNLCVDAAQKVAEAHHWCIETPEGRKEVESVRGCFFKQGCEEGMLDKMPEMLVDRNTGKQ